MKFVQKVLPLLYIILLIAQQAACINEEDLQKHLEQSELAHDKPLNHLTYEQIVQTFYDLQTEFPEYIRVYDAVQQFNNDTLPQTKCYNSWDKIKTPCKFIYAQMTNFSDPSHVNFTQSFYSGNFHGDEVVGPNIVTYLAKYILEKPLLSMLTNNFLVLLPLGNPSGYYLSMREEQQIYQGVSKSIDMNRDFPYDQYATDCFKSAGARIINYIWQQHLFTAAITFHGGMTAIAWPWGSKNHAYGMRGDQSPDQFAFHALGERMSQIADFSHYAPQYPYGTLTNKIYPVEGSFEDWSYAASWEAKYDPKALPKCVGISEKEHYMNDNIARSLTYLIETTEQKIPSTSSYGRWIEIGTPSKGVGHVSRNVRLTLDFIQNLNPQYEVSIKSLANYTLFTRWQIKGCKEVQYTKLLMREKNPLISNITHNNYTSLQSLLDDGFQIIKEYATYPGFYNPAQSFQNHLFEYEEKIERTLDIALVSQCDADWIKEVQNAKPTKDPQTHFVKSRKYENYTVENNGYYINSKKYIISAFGPYLLQNITVVDSSLHQRMQNDVPYDYLYILLGIFIVGMIGSHFFYKKFSTQGQKNIKFEEIHDEELTVKSSNNQDQQSSKNNA